jgi:hypothetical protein
MSFRFGGSAFSLKSLKSKRVREIMRTKRLHPVYRDEETDGFAVSPHQLVSAKDPRAPIRAVIAGDGSRRSSTSTDNRNDPFWVKF